MLHLHIGVTILKITRKNRLANATPIGMQKIVVLTGAGISAESGISTFRDSGGLWEGHDVMEVASVEGWRNDPEKVLEFYNVRRRQAMEAEPNEGHKAVARLEEYYDVTVITQNVDLLHEKAGSSNVIHLHGKLNEACSEKNPDYIIDLGGEPIKIGDTCPEGGQLRPNIVWFGEMVPKMYDAALETQQADMLLVIGTSLVVYPAASLVNEVPPDAEIYVVDPKKPDAYFSNQVHFIEDTAAKGAPKLVEQLITQQG